MRVCNYLFYMQKSLHISICLFNDLFFLLFTLKILYMYVHYLVYVLCSSYIYIYLYLYIYTILRYIYISWLVICVSFCLSHPIPSQVLAPAEVVASRFRRLGDRLVRLWVEETKTRPWDGESYGFPWKMLENTKKMLS